MALGQFQIPELKELILRGEIGRAESIIASKTHDNDLVIALYRAQIAHEHGNYQDTITIARKIVNKATDPSILLSALYWISWGNLRSGNYEICLDYANQGIDLVRSHELDFHVEHAFLLKSKAAGLKEQGKIDQSIQLNTKALEIAKMTNEIQLICALQNNIASIYYFRGNYTTALELFMKTRDLAWKEGMHALLAAAQINIGEVYQYLGEFDLSLEYLEEGLAMYRQTDNIDGQAFSYRKIGETNLSRGNLDLAQEMINESLKLYENSSNEFFIAFTYFVKIKIELALNNKVDDLITELEILTAQTKNPIITQIFQVASSIDKKNRSSLLLKGQAIQILEKVLASPVYMFELTYEATIHYCDLLLQEFILSKDINTLSKVEKTIDETLEKAERNYAYVKVVEALIIKSKVKLVMNQYHFSLELLEKAKAICQVNGLNLMESKVSSEIDRQTTNLEIIEKSLQASNTELDTVKISGILDYMQSITQFYRDSEA